MHVEDVSRDVTGVVLTFYRTGSLGLTGLILFFFKQKTAYEMRISDWSSDVCSSDLCVAGNVGSVVDHAGGDAVGLQLAHQLLRVVLRRPCADQFVERVMCRMACSGIRIDRIQRLATDARGELRPFGITAG